MRLSLYWPNVLICAYQQIHARTLADQRRDGGQRNTTLAPTGSGSAYASQCNVVKQRWVNAGGKEIDSVTTFNKTNPQIIPSTFFNTETCLSLGATPFTLCDGYTRIDGSRTITSSLSWTTTLATFLTSSTVYRNVSQPQCLFPQSDCDQLWSGYTTSLGAYTSFEASVGSSFYSQQPPSYPQSPICGPATPIVLSSRVGLAACAMNSASVQLLYWPVTPDATCNDVCNRRTCPITAAAPSIAGLPNTKITFDTTLTSPTAYIVFEGSWAYTTADKTFRNPQNILIPQEPNSVSSYCGKLGGGYDQPRRVNYADFISPVPAEPYFCQPRCYMNPLPYSSSTYTTRFADNSTATVVTILSEASSNLCSTIWDDYAPVLSIPDAFKTLRPSGFVYGDSNPCLFVFDTNAVLFDPPIALTEADFIAQPTLPPGVSAYPTTTLAPETTMPQPGMPTPPLPPISTDPIVLPDSSGASASTPTTTAGSCSDDSHAYCDAPIALYQNWTIEYPMIGFGTIVLNGVTTLPAGSEATITQAADIAAVMIDGHEITITREDSWAIVDEQTLYAGGEAQIYGQTISVQTNLAIVVVSDAYESTVDMVPTSITVTQGAETGVLSSDGETVSFTEVDETLTVAGQTLRPGDTITLPARPASTSTTKTSGQHNAAGESSTSTTSIAHGATAPNLILWLICMSFLSAMTM